MGSNHNESVIMVLLMFLIFLLFTLLPQLTHAADLYADLEINVDQAGYVSIEGVTNHPDLIVENTEEFNSKKQSIWTLNITKNEVFSDFIFSVSLPKNSEITYILSSGSILIGEESEGLIIKGYGKNDSLSIIIQYQNEKMLENEETFGLDVFSLFLIMCIVILIISFFIVLVFVDKKNKGIFSKNIRDDHVGNLRGLNDRQKKIMHLLQESKIALTQSDIQRELDMPKASVSRNIRRLELKGLIEKENIGMSNLIRLKKP